MEDFRQFLETSRDFHARISRHERISAYYAFACALGTTAITGGGAYIAIEADATTGLIAMGLSAYATKVIGKIGMKSLEWSRKNTMLSEERQEQLENFEQFEKE